MNQKIVVILGMHRSGTSAITRGLSTLGVELGDRLMPPHAQNPKGYWEDTDINSLNISIMKALDIEWYSQRPLRQSDFSGGELDLLRIEAVDILRAKTANGRIFGFKDPRTTRLLPFWKTVFELLGLEANYLITCRNPLSVARSLAKRDGFPHEKSYLLWLNHIVEAMLNTEGNPRVVVDYDRFLKNPVDELFRIGAAFHLDAGGLGNSPSTREFIESFLEPSLRHTQYSIEDLKLDQATLELNHAVFEMAAETYDRLLELAKPGGDPDSVSVRHYWSYLAQQIEGLLPILRYIDKQDISIADRDRQIIELNHQIAGLNQQIAGLNHIAHVKDVHIGKLDQQIVSIYNSTTWKMAWPMHATFRLIKNVKRAIELAGDIIRRKRASITGFTHKPLISVVMPVYNTPISFLDEAIQSVRNQLYPNWELCIADDASTDKAIRPILERHAKEDARIKVVFREQNGHIATASNSALELANGEWVGLLDHDDLLSEDALFWVAHAINQHPGARLIYSDEDKLATNGKRKTPFFKPDWSPHLAISQGYVGHFLCLQTTLIRELGGLNTQSNGAQDYDLWLRASLITRDIVHIPRVLYHWREHAGSTSSSGDAKPYAHEAGMLVVEEYLKRRYPRNPVKIIGSDYLFCYKAEFDLPSDILVSIIIPTLDKVDLLKTCIDSIASISTWKRLEVLILDNNSSDMETLTYLDEVQAQDSRIRVIRLNVPFNWSRFNNIGANEAKGDVLIFLNNDTKVVSANWIESLAGYALLPDVGVVGALLLYEDGTIQHSGVVVGMGGWADHVYKKTYPFHEGTGPFVSPVLTRNVLAVTGACMAISRKKFDELGGFDESFIICGSDVELGLRAHRRGYFNIMCAEARLAHYESKTRAPYVPENDFKQSDIKYAPYRVSKIDPYYNPNLSLEHTTPRVKGLTYDA